MYTPELASAAATSIRDKFVVWQCRMRRHAMRELGGRPTPGMRPRVLRPDGSRLSDAITVVIVETDSAASTAQFRHIVERTHDPEQRYRDAIRELSAAYFEEPKRFSGILTALFGTTSPDAERLAAAADCVLEFEDHGTRFRIPCRVTDLAPESPAFQATYWHNAMFNSAMPGAVRVLAFAPDWRAASVQPPA